VTWEAVPGAAGYRLQLLDLPADELVGDAVVTAGRASEIAPTATMAPMLIAAPARTTLDRPNAAAAYTEASTGTARSATRYFRNTEPGCNVLGAT